MTTKECVSDRTSEIAMSRLDLAEESPGPLLSRDAVSDGRLRGLAVAEHIDTSTRECVSDCTGEIAVARLNLAKETHGPLRSPGALSDGGLVWQAVAENDNAR